MTAVSPVQRRARLAAVATGAVQAVGTAVYAVAVAASTRHTSGWTMVGSRAAAAVGLVVEYVLYAAAIGGVTFAVARQKRWAFTPFLLIQGFFVIAVGWTLVQSGNQRYVLSGAAIIALAVAGAVAAVLASPSRGSRSGNVG